MFSSARKQSDMTAQQNISVSGTMRSLAIEKYCKPEAYDVMELLVPEIKAPDELLIKVHAASINPIDVKAASGALKAFMPNT